MVDDQHLHVGVAHGGAEETDRRFDVGFIGQVVPGCRHPTLHVFDRAIPNEQIPRQRVAAALRRPCCIDECLFSREDCLLSSGTTSLRPIVCTSGSRPLEKLEPRVGRVDVLP